MEQQLQRPKKQKKKQKPVEIQRIQQSSTISTTVESYDWTELHHQEFEAIYPSAPAGPILEVIDPIAVIEARPLLTMDHTSPVVYPEMLPEEQRAVEYDAIETYQNPLETEYLESVNYFRSSMNGGSEVLHDLLVQYHDSLSQVATSRMQLKSLLLKRTQIVDSFWTLHRAPSKVSDRCPDGWTVSHTILNETAEFNQGTIKAFNDLVHNLKSVAYIEVPQYSFQSQVYVVHEDM
jgi:hypothetical protein